MTKVNASNAMLQVLKDWGVDTIYGLPGGSFDSTMNAIHDFRDDIRYIGVRHEEVGALAAVAEAKLTGKIAVTFGSAGPGAAHCSTACTTPRRTTSLCSRSLARCRPR
ncbi:thiamine pyrophosphate-binding protein [Propionibacterium freudenreichii]|uniref:thiamine pyrophosphate-binding protein n=1 Tax=Propionibacterium freudenreichii TaxID=1744 RepID=UPI00049F05E9|nr:thiamine pyrophosphate-binding protein [Propionibacterium freudenreichii]CDP48071.1 Putative uncharacterized protein [Propionibacterium freudenreichii subsp. freudenreichii]